jgi:Gpi18-like mannosyltransferase
MRVRTLLVIGLLIREAFSFWTGHPFDFEIWVRTGYWVAHGVSPYANMGFVPGLSFANDFGYSFGAAVGYLPFWPLLLAGIYKLYSLVGFGDRFVYYFLIKQPIIICDVLVAYCLYRYAERRGSERASFAMKVWLFSPFNIIVSAIWGMFDSIAVLFILLALTVRPGAYRGLLAGLATFAKSIPVIFAIPLSWGPKPLRNLAIAIGLPVVAIWATGWSFSIFDTTMQSTLATGRQSLSAWEVPFYLNTIGWLSNSSLDFYYQWGGYLWIGAVLAATLLAFRWFGFDSERGLVRSLLLITLAFLLLRGQVNEQYSLYLYAFMVIDIAMWSPGRKRLLYASVASVLLYHVTNDLLLIRYVAPVYPHILVIEANLISAVNPERNFLLFFWALLFWLLNAYLLVSLYKERGDRTPDVLA